MPTIYSGQAFRTTLDPGLVMTVVSTDIQSTGLVRHVMGSGGNITGNREQKVPPNTSRIFGPYPKVRHFSIEVVAGHLTYSLSMPEYDFATEQGNVEGFVGALVLKTEDMGKILRCDDTSNVVVTAPPDLPEGFNVGFSMWSTGNVTIASQAGATNRTSKSALSTQYQAGSLLVVKNADGASAEYLLVGDFA